MDQGRKVQRDKPKKSLKMKNRSPDSIRKNKRARKASRIMGVEREEEKNI